MYDFDGVLLDFVRETLVSVIVTDHSRILDPAMRMNNTSSNQMGTQQLDSDFHVVDHSSYVEYYQMVKVLFYRRQHNTVADGLSSLSVVARNAL